MANLSLVFDLLAKDNASKTFKDVGDSAERAGKQGEGFGSGIGKGVAVAAGAIAAAGIGTMFVGFIKDAAESAKIGRMTEAVLKSTGGAAKITADQVGALATSISNKTAVDDETIQSAENLLLTFTKVRNETGKGNDIFNQATQAAIDMSVAMGTDANGAALQMGKALNDPVKGVTALSKAGVSFTQQQKDQIKAMVEAGDTLGAQKIILGEMQTQFGGAAAAAADPMERLKVIAGNLGEAVGGKLLPYVERFSTFLTDSAVPALVGMGEGVSQVFDSLFRGDFHGGPFAEDSGFIDKVFDVREAVIGFADSVKTFVSSDTFAAWVDIAKTAASNLWTALQGVAGFVTGTLIPAFITAGAAVLATAEFFRKHQDAAIALGVVVGGVLAVVVAAWIAQAAVSVTSSASSVAAWFATATASTTSATLQSRSTAQIVVGWIAAAASSIASAATVVAGWVLMGVQSMLQAARMAAAWFIALGPIGWVTAAIIGIAALVIANWDTIVGWTKTAWGAVTSFLGATWDWIKGAASAAIGFLVNLFLNFTGPGLLIKHFDDIKAGAESAWHWVVDKFTAMKDGVVSVFTGIRDTVGTVWDGLLEKVKTPIKVVFDFVNGNMIAPINSLLGKFPGGLHIDDLPHLASGGIVRGPGTGTSDSILGIDPRTGMPTAFVSNGEMVVNAEATRRNRSLLEAINAGYYARGGEVGGPLDWVGSAVSGVKNAAVGAFDWAKDIAEKGARKVAELVVNPLRTTAKGLIPGGNVIGDVVRGFVDKLADSVLGKSDDADKANPASGPLGSGAVGGSWQQLWALVHAQFPTARKTSDYRPGDPGYHGRGKAVDVAAARPGDAAGMLAINKWVAANYGSSLAELIYTPGVNLLGGKSHTYNAATRADHFDHVHMATYDDGGWLKPGYTMAYNGTGQAERVRTAEQESALGGGQMQVVLQLDGGAVTSLLDGRVTTVLGSLTRGLSAQGVHV